MELKYNIKNKQIDEDRQGEVTMVKSNIQPNGRKLYVESYGCAMNFSDSEVVASIMNKKGYVTTRDVEEADIILINTCSIRENAENRVRKRLTNFKNRKKRQPNLIVGILGCMAERLKNKLLEEEKLVDLIAGPDAYRKLPGLIEEVETGQKAVNVLLSRDETYADISPIRLDKNGITSFVSITRGCDNMCSFCVVPFTRGRERSRDPNTIYNECKELFKNGYKEVTLLGQNVDSYRWNMTSKGEVKDNTKPTTNFAELLDLVAEISPNLRIRFSTSHPKDMSDEVLKTIAKHNNICNCIHLPIQSGNTEVLKRMNRGYSREWYLNRIKKIREIIPNCAITTDIITGFCDESDAEHNDTISIIKEVEWDFAYMYKYSERPKTLAQRKFKDNVPENIKSNRLTEIINLQRDNSAKKNLKQIGKIHKVLIEGYSKKSKLHMSGRNDHNTKVVFPIKNSKKGDYALVRINDCTTATLIGEIIEIINQ